MTNSRDHRVLRAVALVAATLLPAACAGKGTAAPTNAAPVVNPYAEPAPVADTDDISFERYEGTFARDRGVAAFRADAATAAAKTAERLRTDAGISFLPGRAPRLRLVDDADAPSTGSVAVRIVDGVRRPEIVVRAVDAASGLFRATTDLPPLYAEAALLAASKDRVPPEWLRSGIGLHFGDALEARALRTALASGPVVRTDAAAFKELEGGFRAAALARIGQGERPFLRYLEARLAGRDETTSLREVGVEASEFLDAAAETERDRTLDDLRATEGLRTLGDVRARLAAGDVAGADAVFGAARVGGEGDAAVVATERLLLRAEIALRRGEAQSAAQFLDEVFSSPVPPLRLVDARYLRAIADANLTDAAGPGGRNIDVLRWHAADPRAPMLAEALGLPFGSVVPSVHGSTDARAAAVQRVAAAKSSHATSFVRRSLRDGAATVRRSAVMGLAAFGDKAVVPDLEAACEDTDGAVRAAALKGLAGIDADRAKAKAAAHAADRDPAVKEIAAALLAPPKKAEPPKPVPPAPKEATKPQPAAPTPTATPPAKPAPAGPTKPPAPAPVPPKPTQQPTQQPTPPKQPGTAPPGPTQQPPLPPPSKK